MKIFLFSLFLPLLILNSALVVFAESKTYETAFIECSAAAVVSVSELTEMEDRVTSFFVVIQNNGKQSFIADPGNFNLSYWRGTGKMQRISPLSEESLRDTLKDGSFQRWASAITDSTPAQGSESVIRDKKGSVMGQVRTSGRQELNMLGKGTVLPGHQVTGMIYFKKVEDTYTKQLLCSAFPIETDTESLP
jgi:hypothetical protein